MTTKIIIEGESGVGRGRIAATVLRGLREDWITSEPMADANGNITIEIIGVKE